MPEESTFFKVYDSYIAKAKEIPKLKDVLYDKYVDEYLIGNRKLDSNPYYSFVYWGIGNDIFNLAYKDIIYEIGLRRIDRGIDRAEYETLLNQKLDILIHEMKILSDYELIEKTLDDSLSIGDSRGECYADNISIFRQLFDYLNDWIGQFERIKSFVNHSPSNKEANPISEVRALFEQEYILPLPTLFRFHAKFNGIMWDSMSISSFMLLFDLKTQPIKEPFIKKGSERNFVYFLTNITPEIGGITVNAKTALDRFAIKYFDQTKNKLSNSERASREIRREIDKILKPRNTIEVKNQGY